MNSVIDRLIELLEAERSALDAVSLLKEMCTTLEQQTFCEKVYRDITWMCTGLARSIKEMGGRPTSGRGDFAAKMKAARTLADRLQLANRGQEWMIERVNVLLNESLPTPVQKVLYDVKATHLANIELCNQMIERLVASREG